MKSFRAAKRTKTWGRSRPRQCFVCVPERARQNLHIAVTAVDGLARALNRDLNEVLNRAKQARSGHYGLVAFQKPSQK